MRPRVIAAFLLALVTTAAGCSSSLAGVPRTTAGPVGSRVVTPSEPPVDDPAAHGRLLTVRIPGTTSHFRARPALLYVPPVLLAQPGTRVPVVVLLHGTHGGPQEWATRGGIRAAADALAQRHHGRAPLIVAPDVNGSYGADSECIVAGGADVERYLTVDVPAWLRTHYRVTAGRWGVAGISEGATCAVMLALRHPALFGSFGDFAGLVRPTVGQHDHPVSTRNILFGGSQLAYDEHDPLWLLAHGRGHGQAGWFAVGTGDREGLGQQARLVAACRAAGVAVTAGTLPGGHRWTVWKPGVPALLDWFWLHVP